MPTETTSTNEVATEEQARELRAALDEQLERVRSLSFEDHLGLSVDEQLAQFIVITSSYPDDALKQALLMTTSTWSTSDEENATLRLPIHLACDTNAPIEVIRWLLDNDIHKESILRQDAWGDLPIHTACSRQDVEVVRLLVESDATQETILTKDHHGALPIHMACRYNAPVEAIQMLLDCDTTNTSLFTGGTYEQLPIHVACRCNLAPDSIQLLLDYDTDKKTVLMEDNAGRLPLHVAYLRNNHKQVLQLLLEAMICHRIERIGLDLWKKDMRQLLTSLATHERDFNANDKLEMTRGVLRESMERAFVLELAIWKASCLSPSCPTMQHVVHLGVKDEAFDVSKFKQECRIKSGAEVVIPGVLSFLEDEPIVKLFEQFAHT